jgi:hypothetical protein
VWPGAAGRLAGARVAVCGVRRLAPTAFSVSLSARRVRCAGLGCPSHPEPAATRREPSPCARYAAVVSAPAPGLDDGLGRACPRRPLIFGCLFGRLPVSGPGRSEGRTAERGVAGLSTWPKGTTPRGMTPTPASTSAPSQPLKKTAAARPNRRIRTRLRPVGSSSTVTMCTRAAALPRTSTIRARWAVSGSASCPVSTGRINAELAAPSQRTA